jgi:two-component system cell cycle response regulator
MARILVVEDDKVSRVLLLRILADDGHDVVEAPTAVKALKLMEEEEEPPDLIVSDVMMPFMDGFEFAAKIREDGRLKHIPIVLCTALADRNTVMRAAKLGIRHYIVKPLAADKVLEQIKAGLDSAS